MDLGKGLHPVIVARVTTGRMIGLVFGGIVIAVMIFMLFAILGALINGEQ